MTLYISLLKCTCLPLLPLPSQPLSSLIFSHDFLFYHSCHKKQESLDSGILQSVPQAAALFKLTRWIGRHSKAFEHVDRREASGDTLGGLKLRSCWGQLVPRVQT